MVGIEEKNNKKIGAAKILAGVSISGFGSLFYGVVLPIGMISTAFGLSSSFCGMLAQTISKNKSIVNKIGSRLRAVGTRMMGAGGVAITSPLFGAIYALEGGYSVYTGKEANIIAKGSKFVFGVVAGPKYRDTSVILTNNVKHDKLKEQNAVDPLSIKVIRSKGLSSKVSEKALSAGANARKLGVSSASNDVGPRKTPNRAVKNNIRELS